MIVRLETNKYMDFLEKKKMLLVAIFLIIALFTTLIGAFSPMNYSEAKETREQLNETLSHTTMSSIFGNNLMLCLFMFAPFLGSLFGIYVMFNTGYVIGAIAVSERVNRALVFASLFMFPHAWLEYLAYSIAMAQSVWLSMRIVQGRFRKEVVPTAILIAFNALALLVAAFVEILLILLV